MGRIKINKIIKDLSDAYLCDKGETVIRIPTQITKDSLSIKVDKRHIKIYVKINISKTICSIGHVNNKKF